MSLKCYTVEVRYILHYVYYTKRNTILIQNNYDSDHILIDIFNIAMYIKVSVVLPTCCNNCTVSLYRYIISTKFNNINTANIFSYQQSYFSVHDNNSEDSNSYFDRHSVKSPGGHDFVTV